MPRDITIVGRRSVTTTLVEHAVAAAGSHAGVSTTTDGVTNDVSEWAVMLDDTLLLTLYRPRTVSDGEEVGRLLPGMPTSGDDLQWIDAVAPWGPAGEKGVAVALRLALALDAACTIAD